MPEEILSPRAGAHIYACANKVLFTHFVRKSIIALNTHYVRIIPSIPPEDKSILYTHILRIFV